MAKYQTCSIISCGRSSSTHAFTIITYALHRKPFRIPKGNQKCVHGTGMLQNLHILTKPKMTYSKTCVKRPLSKRPKIGFQNQSSLNAGQKYCRMLRGEHSAILSTFIKLALVITIFVLSILSGCLFYKTGFTVV